MFEVFIKTLKQWDELVQSLKHKPCYIFLVKFEQIKLHKIKLLSVFNVNNKWSHVFLYLTLPNTYLLTLRICVFAEIDIPSKHVQIQSQ